MLSPVGSPVLRPSSASSTSSNTPIMAVNNGEKTYDEEWGLPRWARPRKFMRIPFPRLRKLGLCLFIMDILIVGILLHLFNPLIILLRRNEELFGARLTLLPHQTPGADEMRPARHEIPMILHQTSATTVVPEKWRAAQEGCKEVYHEFEYKHWTDASARDFIAAEYPWFVDTWDNYAFPIIRADAIRYFILYHYGGIYLDMDTQCNETIPLRQIEANSETHHAVFKSTTPTGVSNDLMITSSRHPVFAAAINRLPAYNDITKIWAPLLPYVAIMIAAGPFFITAVIKNYLLEQPSLPSPTIQVINATALAPFITDLESASWHKGDAKALMWLGTRPWVWFAMGAVGLAIGLHILNKILMWAIKRFDRMDEAKVAKLT